MIPTDKLLAAIAAQSVEPGRASLPRIENATGQRASIYLLDAVSKWTPANARDFQVALASIKAPAIDLFINSPGGSVFEGVAIYNFLKAHPAKITVHVVGLAASIASVIAMAGDEINVADGALMMIHSPSVSTGGNASQLRKDADLLDQIEESILDIYVAKTGRPRVEIKALVQKETWFSADEAVTAKFATRKSTAVKAAAQWKASDFPSLPANAKAFAGTPPAGFATRKELLGQIAELKSKSGTTSTEAAKVAARPPATMRAAPAPAAVACAKTAPASSAQVKVEDRQLTGHARVVAYFARQSTAQTPAAPAATKPAGQPAAPGLTGLARASAFFAAQANARIS